MGHFELWYQQEKVVISEPTISNIEFLIHLLTIKNLQLATIDGYTTAAADHLGHCGQEVNKSLDLNRLIASFLCQLTCQSADIMSSLCGVGVGVRVNNFSSKTTRPRDVLFFLKDTLSIEDEKLFKACKSVCSSVC